MQPNYCKALSLASSDSAAVLKDGHLRDFPEDGVRADKYRIIPLPHRWFHCILNSQKNKGSAGLAHLHFYDSLLSAKKQACGPEARALRGKSIGGKRNPSGDHPVLPQSEAGLSGVTQFGIRNVEFGIFTSFFPFRIPHSAFRISIARPDQEVRRAS
jgi:hypothetical protein